MLFLRHVLLVTVPGLDSLGQLGLLLPSRSDISQAPQISYPPSIAAHQRERKRERIQWRIRRENAQTALGKSRKRGTIWDEARRIWSLLSLQQDT